MITTNNYFTEVKKIGIENLPDTFKKSHELVEKVTQHGNSWDKYNNNESYKRMIDLYITKLNEFAAKKPAVITEQKDVVLKKESKKTTRQHKPKTEPVKTSSAKQVERIEDEITLMKSFVGFHQKQKTKEQIMNLLKRLQKAILEKRINKNSMYAKEIEQIQTSLVTAINSNASSLNITIDDKSLAHYNDIVSSVAPMVSISLLKRYVNVLAVNKIPDKKEKAKRLIAHIERAFDKNHILKTDKYITQINNARANLKDIIDGKPIKVDVQELNGLGFIPEMVAAASGAFIQKHVHRALSKNNTTSLKGADTEVMTIDEAKRDVFDEIGLTGDFAKLIGKACAPTSFMFYGKGGSGKSGAALKLADQLNKKGHSVLYIAGEQFGTPAFVELLRKTNVTGGDNFKIVRSLTSLPMRNFDVIVIDSKDSVGLHKSTDFVALREANPGKIWILTSQGTKSGSYTGDGQWYNEIETLIYCENGVASTLNEKNRWGNKAQIKLF